MCWKRHEYVAPTRRPTTTPHYISNIMNLTGNGTYYGNNTFAPVLPCSSPDQEPCPVDTDPLYCNENGDCCMNKRIGTGLFCNCFVGFKGDRCNRFADDDWILKELEAQEALRKAAVNTMIATIVVICVILFVIVGIVVFIVIRRTKRTSRRPSVTHVGNGTAEDGTEMQPLHKPLVPDTSTSLREKASEDMIANARLSMDDPPANGRNQPGLSWQKSVDLNGAPLDRSISRSVPSGVDKLDHNSNA